MKRILLLIMALTIQVCDDNPLSELKVKSKYICFRLRTKCVCERYHDRGLAAFSIECSEVEDFEFRKRGGQNEK